ncbi:hypothetical protein C0J29_24765 [Mycobacterium paragordonae]|uniref:glycosyltransferase family 4 protein n=1 Tax=Mycobacterium paragordonae TaxID=1389713 RepID=UPI000EA89BCE|nr:glycosyltransferase family 4 protein [Mycobacterium paragordonae]AYE99127.1 hypothetical protein C0J29_24765 [Mycobacterium paragordonae]
MLWLSPWLRPLARVQVEALRRHDADVLLVTSDQHPESDAARDYELVLDPRFRTAATWRPSFAAWRRIRQYRPDVVVTELVRDPRWIALAGRVPRIQLVHDDRPHDAAEQRPSYELEVFDRWGARSAATVTYSNYVAARVTTRRDVAGTSVHVLPLTSDLDPTAVPQPVEHRRDFVMIGRLNPYKNLDVVLRAWQQHIDGNGWRGDKLVLIGDGSIDPARLPAHTEWRSGRYRYADVLNTLAAAKGSVAHYRRASQSGVQVLSMQLGVMPIVSDRGGLPEYQPSECRPVRVDDIAALAATFDELADAAVAARLGAVAARHYAQRFAVDHAAARMLDVIDSVYAPSSSSPVSPSSSPVSPGCLFR